jgi:hypothetical protein
MELFNVFHLSVVLHVAQLRVLRPNADERRRRKNRENSPLVLAFKRVDVDALKRVWIIPFDIPNADFFVSRGREEQLVVQQKQRQERPCGGGGGEREREKERERETKKEEGEERDSARR